MGHTVASQRIVIDNLLSELNDYARALKEPDKVYFARALKAPLKHVGSITYASSMHAWAFLLLSIIVEQEKKIEKLEHDVLAHRRIPDTR